MTRVFLAGPIDYQPLESVIESRIQLRQSVESAELTPVDQYSDAIERFAALDLDSGVDPDDFANIFNSLPDEPYVRAFQAIVAEHSPETILKSPELIPKTMSNAQLEAIVERDLELVRSTDVILADLHKPSCGTTVEILNAAEAEIPVVVVSDSPPIFIRYYADEIVKTTDAAITAVKQDIN